MLRDLGAGLSPFNAWLFIQGLETLGLRIQRHSDKAAEVVRFLAQQPSVSWVKYPRSEKYLPNDGGDILTFGLRGGAAQARGFIDALKLHSLLANVGDAKSLVIHLTTTTHQQLTHEQRLASGVTDDLVRLSVGIEDIIADPRQAFEATSYSSATPVVGQASLAR